MPGNHSFEYAVIRIVPRVEREEFFNVGVILYCRDENFLDVLLSLDKQKLASFCDELDIAELEQRLASFSKICQGAADAGPIGQLDTASRFRWLTAYRSTVIQTSRVHPGVCTNAAETLMRLHRQLVL